MINKEDRTHEFYSSEREHELRDERFRLFKECPLPDDNMLTNLGLFLNSKNLSRILMMDFLYQKNLNVHGVIMEFGMWWGQNISLFAALRGIYEPYNRHRKIIGFDTFEGFPSVGSLDNKQAYFARKGALSTPPKYEEYLEQIMILQEQDNPLGHIKKFEIVKGDVSKTLPKYLKQNPETLVSFAYFDLDMYKPTKDCLRLIWERCVKGTVIGFDELNDHDSPGETLAFLEFFLDKGKIKLQRLPLASRLSYFIVE